MNQGCSTHSVKLAQSGVGEESIGNISLNPGCCIPSGNLMRMLQTEWWSTTSFLLLHMAPAREPFFVKACDDEFVLKIREEILADFHAVDLR
jgi:hypothetical protein